MLKNKKIHIVNHTHWDREWYFTTMDATLLSDQLFSHALDELKAHPEAKFCLDGQSSIISDFLSVNPDGEVDLKRLVASGQLAIGPWYSQTDAFSVNEESYFRNLAIGTHDSRQWGQEMRVGYLPDSFGFNAQMPTILRHFGLDNTIFWRGFNIDKFTKTPYFIWKGLSGQKVYTANLPGGYGSAVGLNSSDKYITEKLLPEIERLTKRTDSAELLLTAGSDQTEIIPDLQQVIDEINEKVDAELVLSSYEEFIAFLRTQELPEYEGEMREPVEIGRVHKSIGSVHYDIKRANFLIEQKLLKRVEPLIAIARANGLDFSNGLLWTAWKKLLAGQAHDSMGGSVMDTVAIDILHRFKEADELADGIENLLAKRLSEKLSLTEKEILVFNTDIKPFSGYKTLDFLSSSKKVKLPEAVLVGEDYFEGKDNILLVTPESRTYVNEAPYYRLQVRAKLDLPAMGYKVIRIEAAADELPVIAPANGEIFNGYYTIRLDNRELILKNAAGQELRNFLEFEDQANDGDTYDFSPVEGDVPKVLQLELKSANQQSLQLSGSFQAINLELTLSLQKDSPLIRCELKVDNQALSHRLRVKVNTGVPNTESIASLPFGFIHRQSLIEPLENWYKEYVEYPIDLEPFDKSVSVGTDIYHVTAYSKGLKEYQFRNSSLYLTLFASTGQLGKPNLKYRPGRASGDTTNQGHVMMPTPLAQLEGELDFEFAFSYEAGKFDEYRASQLYQDYTSPSICYQPQTLNRFIHRLDNKIQPWNYEKISEREFSLLSVDGPAFASCLMPSLYDKDAFLLRLANPTGKPLPIGKLDFSKFASSQFVNAAEEPVEVQDYVPAYDVVTIKLRIKK